MRKLLLAGLSLAALLSSGASAQAGASVGYVCSLTYVPASATPSSGSYGHVSVRIHTDPDCMGTNLGSTIFCSTGATSSSCYSLYEYREAPLMALYQGLLRALDHDLQVKVLYFQSCTYCGMLVEFDS